MSGTKETEAETLARWEAEATDFVRQEMRSFLPSLDKIKTMTIQERVEALGDIACNTLERLIEGDTVDPVRLDLSMTRLRGASMYVICRRKAALTEYGAKFWVRLDTLWKRTAPELLEALLALLETPERVVDFYANVHTELFWLVPGKRTSNHDKPPAT